MTLVMAVVLVGFMVIISTCIIYWVLRDIGDQLRKIADAQTKD